MSKAFAKMKIVANEGDFSARSKALIWLRSVLASSASLSCVNPCARRSSLNVSPNTFAGRFFSLFTRARFAYYIFLVCIQLYSLHCKKEDFRHKRIGSNLNREVLVKCKANDISTAMLSIFLTITKRG